MLQIPIKWPRSIDEVWKANIPHTHLAHEKSDQNWMVVKGEKIVFPGEALIFIMELISILPHLQMNLLDLFHALLQCNNLVHGLDCQMLNFSNNKLNNEGRLWTVLDVGYGVASFGAYLLSSNIITMSLALNDVHQNQIQFALERGISAYLGILGMKRLPYPSRSFELAYCSRCRIAWLQRDGIFLLELNRLMHTQKTESKEFDWRGTLKVAVAGIPKTIDNVILVLLMPYRIFGLLLSRYRQVLRLYIAIEEAQRSINLTHVDAEVLRMIEKTYMISRSSASPHRLSPSPRSRNSTFQMRGKPSSAPMKNKGNVANGGYPVVFYCSMFY
ncbi:hypothetical protein HHK36_003551 [Tetracentron sinense]|uniref:Methyltransferase n=1 Tax=Tetracentron sinense TaxID=13715 RepID=A0A834ZRC8_TETSI|nr:hypothetical protein HHK36_003551 [Tetracentron sinense]